MGVRLNDAPVHARSDAEVVRVDNQPPHDASLAGRWGLTGVYGEPYTARVPQSSPIIEL